MFFIWHFYKLICYNWNKKGGD